MFAVNSTRVKISNNTVKKVLFFLRAACPTYWLITWRRFFIIVIIHWFRLLYTGDRCAKLSCRDCEFGFRAIRSGAFFELCFVFDQVFPQIRCIAVSSFAFCTTNVGENIVCAELWKCELAWVCFWLVTPPLPCVCACRSDVTAGVTSHELGLFLPLTQMCSGDKIWHQLIFVNWSLVGAMVTA